MIDIHSVILDIRFKTTLLESLEWDEDLLETFLIYFDGELRNGVNIETLLSEIKNNFGESTYEIIVELFKEEASNLERYIDNDTEH